MRWSIVFFWMTLGTLLPGCVTRPARHVPVSGYCSPNYQARVGWPDPEKAASVCHCESSGNPNALSPNRKHAGLFQFTEATWLELGGGPVFDPWLNSRRALQLYQSRGWKPWPACSR